MNEQNSRRLNVNNVINALYGEYRLCIDYRSCFDANNMKDFKFINQLFSVYMKWKKNKYEGNTCFVNFEDII